MEPVEPPSYRIIMENFYDILEVPQDASFETVKAAYKRLARILHPDRNRAPDATRAFQRLGYAWDALKDSKTRAAYDRELEAQKQKPQFVPQPPPKPTQPRAKHPNSDDEQEELFFFDDIMNDILGGFHVPPPEPRPQLLRTDSDIAQAQIELRDMKADYQTKVKEVANTIKARNLRLNIHQSEDEVMKAAEADEGLVQRLSKITGFEEAIKSRFAERVAECMESMKR